MRENFPKKKNLRKPLSILATTLGIMLIVSCLPVVESGHSNQDTREAANIEIQPKPTDNPAVSSTTEPSHVDSDKEGKYFDSPRTVTNTKDLHITGNPPEEVDIEAYRLHIEGLIESPLSLSYKDILAYPTVTEVVLLICPGVFQDNAEWTGVPVWVLLEEVGIKDEAKEVVFRAMESSPSTLSPRVGSSSYSAILPLEEIIENDSIFLAHTVNNQILPLEHGYPIRLVAKDRFGYDWVKWVEIIEVR